MKQFVYHYTKSNTAQLILRSLTLRMNRLDQVNDPKESSNRDATFYARNLNTTIFFDKQLFSSIEKDLTFNTYALCCTTSDTKQREDQHENALLPNLWAYYGECHKGVCIVMNKEKINSAINNITKGGTIFAGDICYLEPNDWGSQTSPAYHFYLEDLLNDINGYMDHHISINHKQLFFTKQIAWRDEREYRWIMRTRSDQKFIEIPLADCIEAVIMGSAVSQENQSAISQICAPLGIPVHNVCWRTDGGTHRIRHPNPHINLDGFRYSQMVPSDAVIAKALDQNRNCIPMHITSKNGVMRIWNGDGNDELTQRSRATVLSLDFDSCKIPQEYKLTISASRLSKSVKFPLKVIIKENKPILDKIEEEEIFYQNGFTYRPHEK